MASLNNECSWFGVMNDSVAEGESSVGKQDFVCSCFGYGRLFGCLVVWCPKLAVFFRKDKKNVTINCLD